MGIYDRDYVRDRRPSFSLGLPQTMVMRIIVVTAAVWLIDGLFFSGSHIIEETLWATPDALFKPWLWWKFVTYGLTHDPLTASHILLNMLTLWMFGMDVEAIYGRREFLRLYVFLLFCGGFLWAAGNQLSGSSSQAVLLGASGAISGILLLYVMHYPHRELLLFFVLPVPAWVAGVLMLGGDLFMAIKRTPGDKVAYGVHLAGALMAFVYFKGRWNFGRWGELARSRLLWQSRPRLRVHNPDADEAADPAPSAPPDDLTAELDRILEKIHRDGEASLTRKERKTLEDASRKFQERRRNGRS